MKTTAKNILNWLLFVAIATFISFILVSILSSCTQGEYYSDAHDLHYTANKIIDNPTKLLDYYKFLELPEKELQIQIAECRAAGLKKRADSLQTVFNTIRDTRIKKGNKRAKNNIKNLPVDYMINEIIFNTLLFAPSGYLPKIPKSKVKIRGYSKRVRRVVSSSKSNFKPFQVNVDGIHYKIIEGNDKFGMKHIIKRHAPASYLARNKCPNIGTHLFLKSQISYVKKLILSINKGNIVKITKQNKGYLAVESNLRNSLQIKRTYVLIVDPFTKKVISFYPKTRLTEAMKRKVQGTAGNYIKAVTPRDIEIMNLKKLEK